LWAHAPDTYKVFWINVALARRIDISGTSNFKIESYLYWGDYRLDDEIAQWKFQGA
jgi:hypothetical protein